MDTIQKCTAQRDRLAEYIFVRNDGALYRSHCRSEMELGRCPYRVQAMDTERVSMVCVPCIVEMIGDGATATPSPYLSLLAEHHMLVDYFVIGGTLETGRVQMVEGGIISFQAKDKTKRYRLEDIDVIVPREVLRWSHDELSAATWQTDAEYSTGSEVPGAPRENISAYLSSIGIQPFMEGFTELEAAMHLAAEKPELLERMGDAFYPALAAQIGKTAGTVSCRLSKLIGVARRNSRHMGNYQEFYSAFPGYSVSVKAFLLTSLQYMSQQGELPL